MKLFVIIILVLVISWGFFISLRETELENWCSALEGERVSSIANSVAESGFNWIGQSVEDENGSLFTVVAQSQVAKCILYHDGKTIHKTEMIWD